ncbi:uncharacterized protein LOC141607282 [Silene latifolia]|uniref:uncharacterized protein LOC141607282 n=1 Tax=Silene latifolia TaxID=37657 RepID=UPI003D76E45A
MTTFYWNCRGFGEADDPTIPYLHRCVLKFHPLLLFLQETHTYVDVAYMKTSHLGFPNYFGMDSSGRSGGLLLYWDNSVDVLVLCSNPHFIFCKLGLHLPQGVYNDMYIMFIYGESAFQYRSNLWDHISNVISGCTLFLVIGDFNQVELYSDKFGGSSSIQGRLGENCIMERLDRAYATQDWFEVFPHTSLLNLAILISDHSPIILQLFHAQNTSKRPYRIDNWCLHLPEVVLLVNFAFQTPFLGSLPYVLSHKLAAVRFTILQWVLRHRITYGIDWSSIERDLDLSATDISDLASADDFQLLRSNRLQLISKQHGYWAQRVKLRNEVLDGLPTRFLFNRVRQRSVKQRMVSVRTPAGIWLHDPEEVENEILSYFQTLLCAPTLSSDASSYASTESFFSTLDLPSLSSADCSILSAPFTELDVLSALRTMDGSKSPVPDGITPRFYQFFWPQIGSLVSAAVLQFLNSGVMLKEWNNTHIVLIPKIDHPELITQYRPISLCNVIYHIASKCLANRLQLIIPSIISDSQQAFIPGRLMSDGCLVAHEVLHYINKTKKGTTCYAVLKLDMSKAFDRVSWNFLMAVLRHMGFPSHWRNIIWECISTVSYRVLINGTPSNVLRPTSGLRQGDPISPDLFIICMEVLSRQLAMAEKMKNFTRIKISRYAPTLSHLFLRMMLYFAIDALIAAFWWRRDWNKKTIHLLRRDILHAPKPYGGLGIKNTFVLGQALLLKKYWRITSQPHTLLAKFWTTKYKKDLPIPKSRSLVSNVSYAWSGVCRAVNLTKDAVCWKIGSGKLIDIWSSRWVNGEIPTLNSQCPDPPPPLSSFILPYGDWNPTMLFRYFSAKTAKAIIAMEPPLPRSSFTTPAVCFPPTTATSTTLYQSGCRWITISTPRHHASPFFTCSFLDSALGRSFSHKIRAKTSVDASARALLLAMHYAQSINYSNVGFRVTCRKLSSVLANLLPVPITMRNSVLQIRTLFVLHRLWAVSLATG